jgi:hypothetical protein
LSDHRELEKNYADNQENQPFDNEITCCYILYNKPPYLYGMKISYGR